MRARAIAALGGGLAVVTAGVVLVLDGDVRSASTPGATTTTVQTPDSLLPSHNMSPVEFVSVMEGFAVETDCPPDPNRDAILCPVTILGTDDAGAHWERRGNLGDGVVSTTEGGARVHLRFVDPQVGYAAIDGGFLYETHDGGRRWTPAEWKLNPGSPDSAISSLTGIEEISVHDGRALVVGTCAAGSRCSFTAQSAVGSGIWKRAAIPGPAPMLATPPLDGPSGGPTALIRLLSATSRDGFVWLEINVPCPGWVSSGNPVALDAQHLWMVCTGEPAGPFSAISVYASSDGGATWRLVGNNGSLGEDKVGDVPGTRFEASIAPTGVLWASGYLGWLARSTDGGSTWTGVDFPGEHTDGRPALDWVDDHTGFAWSRGYISRTTDGGTTWTVTGKYPY